MRAFISLKLPPKILFKIKGNKEILPEFTGKKTELKNLHLTLKFLGGISPEKLEEVKLILERIKSEKIESEIKEIGFFDNVKYGIIWLGIFNCEGLQKEIDSALESIFKKEKRFMGHLTIARVKRTDDKRKFLEELKKISVPKMSLIVDKFYLMESELKKEGSEYRVLEEYKLN